MPVEIKVPSAGESVTEVVLARWLKKDGEYAKLDEPVAELETDKATAEVDAPRARPDRRRAARDAAEDEHDPRPYRPAADRVAADDRLVDHVQRGRHDRRQRAAGQVQGVVREEARRQARPVVVLHQGGGRGPEGVPGGQCPHRRAGRRLPALLRPE